MLPEFGHFALILALLLAALQAFFGIAGPMLGRERWVGAVTPALAGQSVMVVTAVVCLANAFIANDFSVVYVAQNSNSALPLFYRVAALWGAHEGSLLLWILLLSLWSVAVAIRSTSLPPDFAARVLGVLGLVSFGFLLFTLATSNPFLRLDPPAPDGRDLNPHPAGPGTRGASADSLHRLRGLCGGVRLCLRGHARRTPRPGVGALDAAVDDRGVGVPHLRHRAGQLLGVLRAWLGRLLVLGSGRERLLHALAGGHGAGAFARGDRQARPVQELDAAAGDPRLLAEHARHLPGALRGAGVGAFLRCRPEPRHVHPGVPHHHDRWGALALCVARAAAALECGFRAWRARILPAVQQRAAGDRRSDGVRRHAGAADLGRAAPGHRLGRAAVLQSHLHALDAAAGRVALGRHPQQLEARAPQGQAAHAVAGAAGRRRARLRPRLRDLPRRARAHAGRRDARDLDSHRLAGGSARSLATRPHAVACGARYDDCAHGLCDRRDRTHHRAVLHHRARHRAFARGGRQGRPLRAALPGRETRRRSQLRRRRRHLRGDPLRRAGGDDGPAEAPVLGAAPGHLRDRHRPQPRQQPAAWHSGTTSVPVAGACACRCARW